MAAILILACVEWSPFLDPELREELRRAEAFEVEEVVEAPPVGLADVPMELPGETVERARAAVTTLQDPPRGLLTLPEVRQSALENNLDLEVEIYNPSIAQAIYEGEQGKFEEILAASGGYSKRDLGPGSGDLDIAEVNPALRVPTRAGGLVSLGLPFRRTHDETVSLLTGAEIGTVYGASVDLALIQPVLRDAGFFVNSASIQLEGLAMRQADARTKLRAIRVLSVAEQSYWTYYRFYEELKVALQQYDYAVDQLNMSRQLVAAGVRTKVEITRAEAGVALRFDAIILAETNRRITERALKRVINRPDLPVSEDTVIVPGTPPMPFGLKFDRPRVADVAYRNRMELVENEIQQTIDDTLLSLDKNATLPALAFDFRYSFSGLQPSFNDTLDQIFEQELNGWRAGVALELPLRGNQVARGQLRASLLRQAQTEATYRALRLSIAEEVYNAMDNVEQDWQAILSNRIAVASAQRTYDAEVIQFRLGRITGQDLLNSLNQLAAAQIAEVRAYADYQNSLVDLAFSTGSVLGKSRIVWTPAPLPNP